MPTHDRSLLEAALIGFQHKLAEVEKAISKLARKLGNKTGVPALLPTLAEVPRKRRKRRKVSAESRRKMAEAQQRRWAKVKRAE